MKKIIFTSMLCVMSSIVFAQLKVTSDGKVGIGITQTPVSRFAVGAVGESHIKYVFNSNAGDAVNMRIIGSGQSPSSYGDFGAALLVYQDVSSGRGDYGVKISVTKPSPTGSGRALGLATLAGNATNGYNWGIVSSLFGSNNGTAILGAVGSYEQGIPITDGKYAGYFYGNVKVTGSINGVVVGNSDIRYKDNIEEFSKSKTNVLSNISRLTPISYNFKQMYFETENNSDSLKTGGKESKIAMYDEKSPMFQKKHFGLVAQDLQKIYPDLVYENDNGYLSVNYIEMIPLLIQSIKELKEEIDILSAASLKTRSTTSSDVFEDIPRAVLYQNAPNPFSSRTVIKFDLPQNIGNASIMIFNMQGSLIKQVQINNYQSDITINGSELNAGMYIYSLIVDGKEVDTKRMILTK